MRDQMTTEANGTWKEKERLYVALELSDSDWIVGSARGPGQRARQVRVKGGDWQGILDEIDRAKQQFGLSAQSEVVCCYEAGRDGFWLARCLESHGVRCLVVDAGSIRRRRGKRHVKTDRLDVETLLRDLIRYESGDQDTWRTVRVPTELDEDLRQIQRERRVLVKERTAHRNRIRGLLISRGIRIGEWSKFVGTGLSTLRMWDGSPLGEILVVQLTRELERLELVEKQLRELCRQRVSLLRERPEEHSRSLECVARLRQLRGLGDEAAWTLGVELFAWREFRNRRQVGGFLGLGGTPSSSGASERDLGIGKDGPGWIRALAIELAWGWRRFQPESELSRWFEERYGPHGKRNRRRGIVALARRLMVAIWQYLEYGIIPQGAVLKEATSS